MRKAPLNRTRLLRTGGILAAAILAVLAAQYFAAVALLISLHLSPHTASPLTIARYLYYYGDRADVRHRVWWCVGVSIVLVGAASTAALVPKKPPLHGDAKFATRAQIAKAGLLGENGILLGEIRGRYLTLDGQQGVCLAAPPRAGKSVGVSIPNLLHWPGSVVCIDVKRELWAITSGYRQECGQDCYLFDPLSPAGITARWNPLFYVGETAAARINDLQKIAEMLFAEVPGTDPFWISSARALFVGVALYVFETDELPKTIGEVLRQGMASDAEGFGAHWRRVIETRARGGHPLSGECVRLLADIVDLAPVTASSIRKTFTSRLDLWQSPLLDAATSGNDFDLRDLRKRRISLYVAIAPDDLRRLRPVLSLLMEQAIGLQTRELPEHNPQLRFAVLMLMDEFAALGRIPIMLDAISYMPGYNVRTVLVVQTPAQLKEVYGEHGAETMLTSLAARIYFEPKEHHEAKNISDHLGATTIKVRSTSRPRFFGLAKKDAGSVNVSEQRRPLMLPQEVRALGRDQELIFLEGLHPILAQKIRYYADPRFRARLRSAAVQPALKPLTLSTPRPARARTEAEELAGVSCDEVLLDEREVQAMAADIAFDPPQGGEWSDPELSAAVEQFLRQFPTR